MEEEKNQETKKEFTVKDFINDNFKLLSALVAFGALIEFSSRLSPIWFSYFLAILFFTCMVIILIEVFKNAMAIKSHDFLFSVFKYVLFWLLFLFVLYWLAIFRVIEKNITAMVIFSGSMELLVLIIIIRFKIFKLILNKRKIFQIIFRIGILIILTSISLYLTNLIAPSVNTFLEQIR